MKKTVLSALIISAISFGAKAQYTASDSVNLGPGGYLNDVFYSFKNGSIKTQSNSDWHLAFSVQASQFPTSPETGASIRVNSSLVLKKLPSSQSASNWRNIDTAGLYALPELLNSDTTWDIGGFNAGYDKSGSNIFDFKWGAYNQSTHNLDGTNVFILKGTGIYKKIFISQLDQDTAWRFIISNLDNTDSSSVVIRKKAYTNKLFAYYNVVSKVTSDREPIKTDWDMLFTRYKTYVIIPGLGSGNFVVTGALSNKGVTVAKIKGQKSSEVYGNITAPFSKNMSAIGWEFHTASPPIVVYDSLTYFVKTISSDIYKVVFTGFKGGSIGKIYFFEGNKSGIQNISGANKAINVFPNPAIDHISVDVESANIGIYSMEGRLIRSVSEGQNIFIGDLANGIYSLRAIKGNSVYTGIFIKE